MPAQTGPVIYYRHPDGVPEWSALHKVAPDGRAFVAVLASADVYFDPIPAAAAVTKPALVGNGEILYYRNPMGLPDTSPVPKQDSMGMDYIPAYSGQANDDGTVRVSLGKLQRTGVRHRAGRDGRDGHGGPRARGCDLG